MFVSSLLALATLPALACVDPQKDYNDYASRTADAHAPPPVSTGSDAASDAPLFAPDASFSSMTFYQSCLTTDAAGNVSEANGFVATVDYVANPSGGGGKVTFSNQTLKSGATSLTDLTGMAYAASNNPVTVNPDGSAAVTFGMTKVPGDANPVNMQDLTFSSTTLSFHIEGESQICCSLNGNLVMPVTKTVTGVCVFRPISGNGPLPTFQLSDYHCP